MAPARGHEVAARPAAHYGGRYIVRGGNTESLEGEPPKRIAISTWKSMEDAKRYYQSPKYSEIIGIRHRACKSRVFLVEGLVQQPHGKCPLMAHSGHPSLHCTCPLPGVKRT
jgi:uncharacterized protein (DUF1330 family)